MSAIHTCKNFILMNKLEEIGDRKTAWFKNAWCHKNKAATSNPTFFKYFENSVGS